MEHVKITKLSQGFSFESLTTKLPNQAVYCSSIKGVVAELYRAFEGKSKLGKDQTEVAVDLIKKLSKSSKK